jgi:NAD(P)H-binding
MFHVELQAQADFQPAECRGRDFKTRAGETNFETEVPKPNQPAKVCLRLFILGATGRTGRTLAAGVGERGHQITAFVRSPQKLGELRERVNVRQGDPRSVAELREALAGHDAVVSALGPPGLGWTTVLRDGARTTVAAMQAKACGDC